MSDIISEWLGFDINEVSELSEVQKEQSKKIIKLIESEDWKVFDSFLKMKLETLIKPVEFYAEKPNFAHFDSGYKRCLLDIEQFINSQKTIFEKYVKESTKEVENTKK